MLLKALGFFLIPLYTRALTPNDYGIIGFCNALMQVCTPLISLGLINNLPPLYYSYKLSERKNLISTVFNVSVLYGLVITTVLMIIGPHLFKSFNINFQFYPFVTISLLSIFISNFYYLPLGIFNMEENTKKYIAYSISIALVGFLANIVLVLFLKKGAIGTILANLLSSSLSLIIVGIILLKIYTPKIELDKLKASCKISLPALPHLLAGTFWRSADRFFLAGITTIATTGIYSLAMNVSSIILIIMGGATTALNPIFFKRINSNDPLLSKDWGKFFLLFIFGGCWITLGLAILSPEIIYILAPEKYYSAIPLIPILVYSQLLMTVYWFFSPGVGHTRKTWVYPLVTFPSLIVNIILNFILIPKFGAKGAAWALLFTSLFQAIFFAYFSLKCYSFPIQVKNLLKLVFVLLIISFLAQYFNSDKLNLYYFFIKFLFLISFPILLLFLRFFPADDINKLKLLFVSTANNLFTKAI